VSFGRIFLASASSFFGASWGLPSSFSGENSASVRPRISAA